MATEELKKFKSLSAHKIPAGLMQAGGLYVPISANSITLSWIRKICLSSWRSLLPYLFARRARKLAVVISEVYHFLDTLCYIELKVCQSTCISSGLLKLPPLSLWRDREALFISRTKLTLSTTILGIKSEVIHTTFEKLTEKSSDYVCILFYKLENVNIVQASSGTCFPAYIAAVMFE
jgi:hypothetical protein